MTELTEFQRKIAEMLPEGYSLLSASSVDNRGINLPAIAAEEKAAWIKTATGFNGDTTVDMVKGIKKIVGKQCKIKAAGGIRDIETAKEMLKAGAASIGTSSLLKFED